jgi:hypothetical protein
VTAPLSSSWAGSSHRAVRSAQSPEQRLALALGPVRSIIRVVDTHVPAFSVNWAAHEEGKSISFTDFKNGRIAINPLPILSGMDLGEAIDIEAGFGLHEASHAEESRDRYKDLVKPNPDGRIMSRSVYDVPAFEPFALAIWLWNLVEDVRIEDCTMRKWPGTAPYFRKVLDWMWDRATGVAVQITDYLSSKIEDRMKVVFTACRFPEKIDGMTYEVGKLIKRTERVATNADIMAEVEWWQAWQADYLDDRATVAETIQRGLDHLAEDAKTKQEMDGMAEKEAEERRAGEKVRAQLERLLRDGIGDTPVCITADGEIVPLDPGMAEKVDRLIREQLESRKPLFTDNDNRCDEVRVTKPEETADSRRSYIGKPSPLVEALRSALVFRQAKPQWDLKLQKSGHLDDEELWRLSTDDVRVFSERVIEERADVALGLLVDMSGSMAGPHLRTAQRLAQTFLWAVHDDDGVEPRVWGHTGDLDSLGSDIFRLWEPGDPMERLGLINELESGDNYDGFAIAYCVERLKDLPQPQKALIVLSDGYPAGASYGGLAAQQHMRHICDWAERQGVNVFQIAIDHGIRAEDQERMFGPGRWLGYSTDARLPKDLGRLLARLT